MKQNNLTIAHKSDGHVEDSQSEQPLYEILKGLPKPEARFKLNAAQKKWWYWFGYEFIKTKQISELDLIHLQKASFWMDARCQAMFQIHKEGYDGLVQTFKSGATNVTGHVSIIEKADKHLDEVSAHFGLSIKDRMKIKTDVQPDNQLSLFDKVVQKLTAAQ
ncbi:hypothetical protein [Mesoflavibacter profundi]|uniref:hypothetical protein n=1 Tax=Mesoflavibacter profundi TaxID=2708110 RepID=UPI0035123D32